MKLSFSFRKNGSTKGTKSKVSWYHIGAYPRIDWLLLLVFFILVNLAFVFVSLLLFLKVNKGESLLPTKEPVVGIENFDPNLLDSIVADFTKKDQVYNGLKTSRPLFVDPSL